MPFERFVETGRVALISDGEEKGKLVSIVDVIDQTRVLVDGPAANVSRRQIRLSQLHLTKFRLKFPYTASTRVVRKAWTEGEIDKKWSESTWAKKLANKEKRRAMTDFDRFKLKRARKMRNKIRTLGYNYLKKVASRDGTLYGKKKMPKNGGKPLPRKPNKKQLARAERRAAKGKGKPAKK